MAEVSLIDFSFLNGLTLSTFTEGGPQFSNQDSRLGPIIEKAKKLSTLQYPRSISVTSAILISKVQPCPTSSGWRGSVVQNQNHGNPPMLFLSNVEMPIMKPFVCRCLSSSAVICYSITRRSWSTADISYYYYYLFQNRTINYWDSIISITLWYCTDKVCI